MKLPSRMHWIALFLVVFIGLAGCSEDPQVCECEGQNHDHDTDFDDQDVTDDTDEKDTSEPPDEDVVNDTDPPADDEIWMTAYFASWKHYVEPGGNWGNIHSEDIDWDSFTHLSYFAFSVTPEGDFGNTDEFENMNEDRQYEIIDQARAAEKPVLASIGGAGNEGFHEAIKPASRDNLIDSLLGLIDDPGFDGIDLDLEPIRDENVEDYKDFVVELHDALQEVTTHAGETPLLITATAWQAEMHAELAQYFDQINLMTYDLSGAWEGWETWHNSPVYTAGNNFDSTGREMPSVDRNLHRFLDVGVPPEKLGIGLDFYGYVWEGVSEPREKWDEGSEPNVIDNVPYHDIMEQYFDPELRHWDDDVEAVYLSIPDAEPPLFVTYEDAQSMEAKVNYIYDKGIGGGIIWELGGGFLEDAPEDEKNPLLDAIRDAM